MSTALLFDIADFKYILFQALKRTMSNGGMDLDLIVKEKVAADGNTVIQVWNLINYVLGHANVMHQLETAAGSAMKHFNNAHGIHVSRSRFLPVKTCSDLLLIRSDLYSLQNGRLSLSSDRIFATTPVIKLGDHYKKVSITYAC